MAYFGTLIPKVSSTVDYAVEFSLGRIMVDVSLGNRLRIFLTLLRRPTTRPPITATLPLGVPTVSFRAEMESGARLWRGGGDLRSKYYRFP